MSVTTSKYNGTVKLEKSFRDQLTSIEFPAGDIDVLSSLDGSTLVPASTCTVKFQAGYDDPSVTMEDETAYIDDKFKLPECKFDVPEDTTFIGWLSEDGRLYPENEEAEISGDCTFTAQWKLNYDLKVGGVTVTPENKNDILNDGGSAVFDSSTNTLTLSGEYDCTAKSYYDYVFAQEMDLTINGTALIEADDMKSAVRIVYGKLTLDGDFRCYTGDLSIMASDGIMIRSGRIIAESYNSNSAIYSAGGDIVIGEDVESVDASSLTNAVQTNENIVLADSLYIKVPENGHVNGGIIETEEGGSSDHVIIEPAPLTEPVFKGHQLILSGSLGLKFGVKFPEGIDSEGSYVTFTVSGQEQTAQPEDGGERKIYTCYLNTLQMAEKITAVLHYGDNQTVTAEYSLTDYFNYFDEHEKDYNAKTLTLVHAIANYGYFAYPYLVQLHHLEGKYTPITKYYTTSFDIEEIKQKVSQYTFAKGISDSQVSAASYKLSLDSDTALSVMVKVPAGTEVSASAEFNGQTYTMTKDSDTVWSVKIPGIKASQLGDTITVSGTAGGNFTINVSALSYVRSVLNSDKYKGDAQNAVMALYKYYEAVKGYN